MSAARVVSILLPALVLAGCESHRPARMTPGYRPGPGPSPWAPASATVASPPAPPGGRACGRLAHEPVRPLRSPWSGTGGVGSTDCDRLETVWGNVPHEHRACQADADCVVVTGNGNCFSAVLSRRAAGLPDYREFTCVNPLSGACAGVPQHAECAAGCCEARPGP
ncbi:MAG: hypothetical protein HY744_02360 [Deltaproteobacteria bacterium]|nr:hypothetical protein [Deltaproteobacteria bacterium]